MSLLLRMRALGNLKREIMSNASTNNKTGKYSFSGSDVAMLS